MQRQEGILAQEEVLAQEGDSTQETAQAKQNTRTTDIGGTGERESMLIIISLNFSITIFLRKY